MIVDTSALVAVLIAEPGHEDLLETMLDAPCLSMSAGALLECSIVLDRRFGPAQQARFDRLLDTLHCAVEPVTAHQVALARQAHHRFGPGSGSGARLNFGDCFTYALAIDRGEPLLLVGDDFAHTDVDRALKADGGLNGPADSAE